MWEGERALRAVRPRIAAYKIYFGTTIWRIIFQVGYTLPNAFNVVDALRERRLLRALDGLVNASVEQFQSGHALPVCVFVRRWRVAQHSARSVLASLQIWMFLLQFKFQIIRFSA